MLGIVRILQPVHGYDVRRELLSWRIDGATNSKPGSVYSALKHLEKDGLVAVSGTTKQPGVPARTEYVLTAAGEQELAVLLRSAWWDVELPAEPLIPALCLMQYLPRDELVAALTSRIGQLESRIDQQRSFRASIRDGATGAGGEVPEHVREIMDFATARLRSEVDWARTFVQRLREGTYELAGERPPPA